MGHLFARGAPFQDIENVRFPTGNAATTALGGGCNYEGISPKGVTPSMSARSLITLHQVDGSRPCCNSSSNSPHPHPPVSPLFASSFRCDIVDCYRFSWNGTNHAGGQLFFIMGMVMFLTYYVYYSLWPVFVTTTLSLLFMLYLISLKGYLEHFPQQHKPDADRAVPQDNSPGTALLPADQLAGHVSRVDEGPSGDHGRSDGS